MPADDGRRIAIVGAACRVPGARDPAALWRNLRAGVKSIRALSDDELRANGVDGATLARNDYVKFASILDDADRFDASFFYLSAREAERIDPQLRIFLETAWAALEDAGCDSERHRGSIGVFAGSLLSTYLLANLYLPEHGGSIERFMRDLPTRMGNDANYLATRASYHLNLTGPSVGVQTACSTSLVAVHLAAQSLLVGECDVALAGGVSIRFPQAAGYHYERDGILSPDGECRPFDAAARGTVFGNGVGVVVLKRLDDALSDGDTIRAVLLGSAVGNEGAKRAGYAAPSVDGQARVIAEAVAVAGVDPGTISYVEAHGTGTAMGDPIEFAALARTYPGGALGSIKANLGHLSIAAGVIGLIKTMLMLEHREVPPQLCFERWNPECAADGSRFQVCTQLTSWETERTPLRAGVSSFGMGGTNAHLVLEEAPPARPGDAAVRPRVLPLSAKSPAALAAARERMAAHLGDHPDADLGDVAYTAAVGRRTFNHRAALVASDAAEARRILVDGETQSLLFGAGSPGGNAVAFLFPGQGAQHAGMGADWYRAEPRFREAFDECAALLAPSLGLDLRDLLYPDQRGLASPPADLRRTDLAQPALFAVEYALARLWMAWGVAPRALLGHSVGEYVAACLAGVWTLADALRIVAARGRLVQALPPGAMAAVARGPDALAPLLDGAVAIAAINEPQLCTISGPSDAVARVVARLAEEGIACRPVHTSHAFHSPMMEPAVGELEALLREVPHAPPRIPFVSNLTGTWITDEQAGSARYWAEHLRRPVRFADGVRVLFADPQRLILEVGPGQTLATFARRHPDRERHQTVLDSAAHTRADHAHLMSTLGRLWLAGVAVDWPAVYAHERRRRVPLPTYPFESQRYWVERAPGARPPDGGDQRLDIDQWLYVPSWRQGPTLPRARAIDARRMVVFVDGAAGEALAARLAEAGHSVTTVAPGPAFERIGDRAYQMPPGDPQAALSLVRALASPEPPHFVHAWLAERAVDDRAPADRFEECQARGLHALLALAQALARADVTAPLRLDVLTRGLHRVTGEEVTRPEQATIAAGCRVVAQEYRNVRARAIDLSLAPADDSLDALVDELFSDGAPPLAVALRGARRWVLDFERLPWSDTLAAQQRLRAGGVYLITGGLGQIGSLVAEMLLGRYGARLALLTREPPAGVELERLERLRALGADVLLVHADVADEARLSAALDEAVARFGALHGVIHAAGLPGERWDRTLVDTTARECGWHFRAKAHGVLALERALAGRDLDFCLLMSSLAGVLGGLRLFAYGAANHFMDHLAARADGRTRWISVDWDVWQHHQEEKRSGSALGRAMDDKAIRPDDGLEILRRVLCLDGPAQVAVSTHALGRRLDQWVRASDPAPAHAGRFADKKEAAPAGSALAQRIGEMVAAALGVDRVGPDDDIFELGGDSLMMVRLLSEVRDEHGLDVSLAEFLDRPSAGALAALVEARRRDKDDGEVLSAEVERHDHDEVLLVLSEIEALAPVQVEEALAAPAAV